jgi:hypothetical protein
LRPASDAFLRGEKMGKIGVSSSLVENELTPISSISSHAAPIGR